MRYRDGRRSICVSSQSGCPLTCTFCATGAMRFARNLTASEILDQALHFRRIEPIDHCVFMGMGEPLMNLDNVLAACERLPDIGITHRRIAISTVGWIPGIERLAEEDMPVRLALSVHAADEALRSELMPVNDRYPLTDVIEACRAFYARKRRRVFVEYVMLAGVNDRYEQALALARVLSGGFKDGPPIFKVNLIPYNPTAAGPLEGVNRESIAAFRAAPCSPADPRHRPPHPRARHRRGLRPARRTDGPGTAVPQDVAGSRAGLARAQQALAQLGLLLRGRVPAGDVGQLLQGAQPEQLQELGARAIQDRAELGVAGLLDQAAVEQRGDGRVGADPADAGDLRARYRLQVGDDRERLGLGGRERGDARAAEQPPRGVLGGGVARERPAAAQLAQPDPATPGRVLLGEQREGGQHGALAGLGGLGQLLGAQRIARQEQQRLDRGGAPARPRAVGRETTRGSACVRQAELRGVAHPAVPPTRATPITGACAERGWTAMSPKLSPCSQSASPRL